MPTITRNISRLRSIVSNPLRYINIQNDRVFFSNLRIENSQQDGTTVFSPTISRFFCEWNFIDQQYELTCSGEDIESCKQSLCDNMFPRHVTTQAKNVAWVRMIMAFNMYSEIREYFSLQPHGKVDIILSSGSSCVNYREIRESMNYDYHILHVEDCKLSHLITLSVQERIVEFWQCIFEIYESQRHGIENLRPSCNNTIQNVEPVTDTSVHALAQEYLSRIDDDVTCVIPSSKQIAGMISQIDNLPSDVRKFIYDICIAFYISHPS